MNIVYIDQYRYIFYDVHADIDLYDGEGEPPYPDQIRGWWEAVGCRTMEQVNEVLAWGDVTHWIEGNVYHVKFNQPVSGYGLCRSDAMEDMPVDMEEFEYSSWDEVYEDTIYYNYD